MCEFLKSEMGLTVADTKPETNHVRGPSRILRRPFSVTWTPQPRAETLRRGSRRSKRHVRVRRIDSAPASREQQQRERPGASCTRMPCARRPRRAKPRRFAGWRRQERFAGRCKPRTPVVLGWCHSARVSAKSWGVICVHTSKYTAGRCRCGRAGRREPANERMWGRSQ
jgi:hypothetical protein